MAGDRQDIISNYGAADHIVLFNRDDSFLAGAVASFLSRALAAGRGALIIAGKPRRETLLRVLASRDMDVHAARAKGQLVLMDAEETLNWFMEDGRPDPARFEAMMGAALDRVQRGFPGTMAVYSEMVDVLRLQRDLTGAVALEKHLSDLLTRRPFALFCAYNVDPLNIAHYDGAIQRVCQAHTHVISFGNASAFQSAVENSAHEVLGQPLSVMLKTMAAKDLNGGSRMPIAQAMLIWAAEHMPTTAEKLFARTKALLPS